MEVQTEVQTEVLMEVLTEVLMEVLVDGVRQQEKLLKYANELMSSQQLDIFVVFFFTKIPASFTFNKLPREPPARAAAKATSL